MIFTRLLVRFNAYFVVRQRHLTRHEVKLVRSVFANDIVLDQVRIVAHKAILKNYACSPNGNIYININQWQEDFSHTDIYCQSWFIHELVHVWQRQQGMPVVRHALFDRRYRYQLSKQKCFLDYGVEQQAQMVQDYFLSCCLGQPNIALAQCIPFILTD